MLSAAAAPQPTSAAETIGKLKDALETCEKREEHLQRKVDNEINGAKKFSAAGKKREALQCLKRKKMYDVQIDNLQGQKDNLVKQMLALEQMNVTREVLQASKKAAVDMKTMTSELGGTEGVERLQEDIEDSMAEANEIQETMSRAMDMPGVDLDDDELLAELEGLEEDELNAELSKVDISAGSVAMPSAGTHEPVSLPSAGTKAISAEEEDELAALEARMAM